MAGQDRLVGHIACAAARVGAFQWGATGFELSCAGHPYFFNQLSQGLDTVGMAGDWLIATANANMFTYEIAPVFILMESVVLAKMREIIGFHNGDSIFAPGNTATTLLAKLYCAWATQFLRRRDNLKSICANCGPSQNVPRVQEQGIVELS